MKWLPVNGSVQHGIGAGGRRYSVVEANSKDFVAYELGATTGIDLGTKPSAEEAREVCEDRERYMESLRRRA